MFYTPILNFVLCRLRVSCRDRHVEAAYRAACGGGNLDAWLRASPDCGAAARSERSGRVSLNVEQADRCLHSLTGSGCGGFSCSEVLVGSVPEGGVCNNLNTFLGDECVSGFFCPTARTGACTSICSPVQLLSEGQSCGGNLTTLLALRRCSVMRKVARVSRASTSVARATCIVRAHQ